MQRFFVRWFIVILFFNQKPLMASEEPFAQYDIRVVRPKFFEKARLFELAGRFDYLANDSFLHSLLAELALSYHFSEAFALELAGGYGLTLDRDEKATLRRDFTINPVLYRTAYLADLSLMMTPMYGKAQLPNGNVVYFDNYFVLGGGATGQEWRYSEFCARTTDRTDGVVTSPTLAYGFGQRVFYSRPWALLWEMRGRSVFYDGSASQCDTSSSTPQRRDDQLFLKIGLAKFL